MVRFKNRYLLLEAVWRDGKVDESIDEAAVAQAVRESVALNFGDHGAGSTAASLQVKYFNPFTNLCILRCERDDCRKVWCSVSMISDVNRRKVMLRMLHVAGTLESCQEAAVAYSKAILAHVRLTAQQRDDAVRMEERLQALEL